MRSPNVNRDVLPNEERNHATKFIMVYLPYWPEFWKDNAANGTRQAEAFYASLASAKEIYEKVFLLVR